MSSMNKLKIKLEKNLNFTSISGGPSSPSSAVYSSPILLKSQTIHLLSLEADAKIHSLNGDHSTLKTSLVCYSKV